jgi:uncharacterized FlaG/YvyC family protein
MVDSQSIGPVEKKSIQVDRKLSSEKPELASGGSTKGQKSDTVSLSQRGQASVSQQIQSSKDDAVGPELRKIDIIDNNQVIIKILDGKTQKVVRQIPKEEEIRLKEAIQENLDSLANDSAANENLDRNV